MRCMIAEAATQPSLEDASAAVLFTKYMDNTYLGFYNIPDNILTVVCHFIEVFQHMLYQVPFKWEPGGQFLNWGECSVMCTTH